MKQTRIRHANKTINKTNTNRQDRTLHKKIEQKQTDNKRADDRTPTVSGKLRQRAAIPIETHATRERTSSNAASHASTQVANETRATSASEHKRTTARPTRVKRPRHTPNSCRNYQRHQPSVAAAPRVIRQAVRNRRPRHTDSRIRPLPPIRATRILHSKRHAFANRVAERNALIIARHHDGTRVRTTVIHLTAIPDIAVTRQRIQLASVKTANGHRVHVLVPREPILNVADHLDGPHEVMHEKASAVTNATHAIAEHSTKRHVSVSSSRDNAADSSSDNTYTGDMPRKSTGTPTS